MFDSQDDDNIDEIFVVSSSTTLRAKSFTQIDKYDNKKRHSMKRTTLNFLKYHRESLAHKTKKYTQQQIIIIKQFQRQHAKQKIKKNFFFYRVQKINVEFKKKINRRKREFISREMKNTRETKTRYKFHVENKKFQKTQQHDNVMQKEINKRVMKRNKIVIIDEIEFN